MFQHNLPPGRDGVGCIRTGSPRALIVRESSRLPQEFAPQARGLLPDTRHQGLDPSQSSANTMRVIRSQPGVVLVVQNKCQQRLIDLDPTVVIFDEAQFFEFVHEEIHARACTADYFRQSLLGNSWQFVVWLVLHSSIAPEQAVVATRGPVIFGFSALIGARAPRRKARKRVKPARASRLATKASHPGFDQFRPHCRP
jgi:hypothetical protein